MDGWRKEVKLVQEETEKGEGKHKKTEERKLKGTGQDRTDRKT